MTYWAEKTRTSWYVEGNNNLALTIRNLEHDDGYTLDDFRRKGVECDGYRYKLKETKMTSEGVLLYRFRGERIDMPRCDIYPPPRKSIPKAVRERVRALFGGRCAYCGAELGPRFAIDHLNPISMFSIMSDTERNYVPACQPCNHFKDTKSVAEFRRSIAETYRTIQERSAAGRIAARFGILNRVENPVFHFEKLGFHTEDDDGIWFRIVDADGRTVVGMAKNEYEDSLRKERQHAAG